MRLRMPVLCVSLAVLSAAFARAQAPAPASTGARVPIEAFVELDQYSSPQLSPDGKHLAVNVRMKRGDRMLPTMTIYSLPEKQVVSTIILPGFEIPLYFSWLTNQRLIVQKGLEVGLREQPVRTGEVVAVNFDGSKPEYLFGYKGFKQSSRGDRNGDDYGWGNIAQLPRARTGHVFIDAHQWEHDRSMLYDINAANASRKLVADIPRKEMGFMLLNNGVPLFSFGRDDDNDPVLLRRDAATDSWTPVDKKLLGALYHPFSISNDDRTLYSLYSANGGPNVFISEDIASGERRVVAHDSFASIHDIQYSAFPAVPFAVSTNVDIPKTRYLDANSADAKLHQMLSAQFPDAFVDFINFSDDGKMLLFRASSDRDPGSYYLFDRATGKADLLMTNMEKIDPDQMAPRLPIHFKGRDGTELAGYLTLPANPGKKKLPMVVLPHGGPFDAYDNWFFDVDAQFLANRGYAVLQVNFRGSGGRGVAFRDAGYRQYAGKILDDLIDGVKWANARPDIDAGRVCVYGGSFGGYAAMMMPVREPAMFKCAIGYSGRYDLMSRFKQETNYGDTQMINYLHRTMGDNDDKLRAESPVNLAEKITLPVLLVHGGKDKTTELNQAEAMRAALTKAGHPPEWLLVDSQGHGFYDAEYQKTFYLKLEAFLDKHIGH